MLLTLSSSCQRRFSRRKKFCRTVLGTSRTAAAHENIWTDIFSSNATPIAESIEDLIEALEEARDCLKSREVERISEWLRKGRLIRESLDEG